MSEEQYTHVLEGRRLSILGIVLSRNFIWLKGIIGQYDILSEHMDTISSEATAPADSDSPSNVRDEFDSVVMFILKFPIKTLSIYSTA